MMPTGDALAKQVVNAGVGERTRALLAEWRAAADDMNPEAFARWIDAVMSMDKVDRQTLS